MQSGIGGVKLSGKRRTREERKAEIWLAAKEVFLRKGFAYTTMEDIIERTELSKGGFYHYYSNTKEIIIDMMTIGNLTYMSKNRYMLELAKTLTKEEQRTIIENAFLDKSLMVTDDKKLYTMFLYEMVKNEQIWEMYKTYEDEFFQWLCGKLSVDFDKHKLSFIFVSRVMNAILLGQHTFREPDVLIAHKDDIRKMIRPYIDEILGMK